MPRLTTLLLTSTLLSVGLVLPSFAQQAAPLTAPAPSPAADPAAMPAPAAAKPEAADDEAKADDARAKSEAADRSAMFEAHLAALHAGLALTADQDKLWPPVESAFRGFAAMRSDMHDRRADMRQDRADEEPIATLRMVAQDQLDHAQALRALADAADPLYAALDMDQRHRMPMLMEGLVPPRGPLAHMVEQLGEDQRHADRADERGPMRHRWDDERGGEGADSREGMDRRGYDRRAEMEGGHHGWRHGWEQGRHDGWRGEDDGEIE